ncbi:MAG: hypothetical protein IK028_04480 [Bacilli bacterium]|nr:hypothetical protein [Bacilli bacterium]
MMKNKLKEAIESVGLSYRKEILKIVLANLILLLGTGAIYYFTKNIIYTIMLLIGLVVVNYMLLSRFADMKKTLAKKHENELITIITYFEVYIRNKNNVYQSFNLLIPYCSSWMKDKVETLLKEIDNDKSVQPFVNFANNFSQLSSHSLLLSIYQMVDQGENSHQLEQFDVIFDELARNRHKEMMEQKEKSLGNMSTFPLIGAGAITVTLTISIISVLGDLMNVI